MEEEIGRRRESVKRRMIAAVAVLLVLLSGCGGRMQNTEGSTAETGTAEDNTMNKGHWESISQEDAALYMTLREDLRIVDVRRQDEYEAGHIPGAICIPNEEIGTEKPALLPDPDQMLLVYCRSGRRSKEAAEKLARIGYTRIYEFGGILDWTGETVAGAEPGQRPIGPIPPAETADPGKTDPAKTGCAATLIFSSFDGGGPEYEFITDEPAVISWEAVREYKSADHDQIDGAAYDVVVTLHAQKEGSATFTVRARSPITDDYDAAYYVTVDGALNITVSEPVIYEIEGGTRATDEVIRPVPVLAVEAGGVIFYADPEDDPAAAELIDLLSRDGALLLMMYDDGGTGKAAPLPWTLTGEGRETTAQCGDVILTKDGIVVCCGLRKGNFTRLARIGNASEEELREALGTGNASVRFWVEWSE